MIVSKIKVAIVASAVMALLAGTIVIQQKEIRRISGERDNYRNNTESLMTGMKKLKSDSLGSAYEIQSLSLKNREYAEFRQQDLEEINRLGIKLKNVMSVGKQNMAVNVPISSALRDTVIRRDTVTENLKYVSFSDRYATFTGTIDKDSIKANISVPVTISQILYKIPKHKFLWWSWGIKSVRQVIRTDNPYVTLNYAEYINLNDKQK